MNPPDQPGPRIADTTRTLLYLAFPAWLVLLGTFALPRFDLEGRVVLAAYGVSESGGKLGVPLVLLFGFGMVLSRPGLTSRRRAREAVRLVLVLAPLLAGAAWLNEHVLKPAAGIPRPNVQELAEEDALGGKSAEEFYALGEKPDRSRYLAGVLGAKQNDKIAMQDEVREHWIKETGFSFPSGHSLASMTLAVLFAGLGLHLLRGPRRWALVLLLVWAVAVCYSRPVLRVHSPTDITVGGLMGLLLGTLGFWASARAMATIREVGTERTLQACTSSGDPDDQLQPHPEPA